MKFLVFIFGLWYGVATANVYKWFTPALDEAVNAFQEGMSKSGSLRYALDLPNAVELDQVENDIKTELSKKMKQVLEQLLENLQRRIEKGMDIIEKLFKKVKEVKQHLKETDFEVDEDAKEKTKDVITKLLEKYVPSIWSLEQKFETVTSSEFGELIKKVRQNILDDDTVNKIRDYVLNLKTDNPIIKVVQEYVRKLNDDEFRELLRFVYQRRLHSRDLEVIADEVNDFFTGLEVNLKEKTLKFQGWIKNIFDKGFSKLKEKYGMIQAIIKELISHAKDLHREIAREALELFHPYKEDLGILWKQLYEFLKEQTSTF